MSWTLTQNIFVIVLAQAFPIFLAFLGLARKSWAWWSAAVVMAGLIGIFQSVQAFSADMEERQVRKRVGEVIQFLKTEIQFASNLEYRMRGDPAPDTKTKLDAYVTEIEAWRNRTGNSLAKELPGTGADAFFLAAVGEVGRGPMVYEYYRLRNCQAALFAILGSVDSFVRRARFLAASPQGTV